MTVITHLARSSHFSWVTHAFPKGNLLTKPKLTSWTAWPGPLSRARWAR